MTYISKTFLITFLAFAFINAFGQNREINFEKGKWASILEKSKAEHKMIYLDCYAVWCGPCRWMAKNVFTNDTAADFYNANFINVEMDMEKGEGVDLAKKFGLKAYPTMLYLNENGDVIHRTCGSSTVAMFVDHGKDALNPEKQLATIAKKFNYGNTDASTAVNYLSMLESGCQDYTKELSAYLATQKENDLTSSNNWKIIYRFANDYSSKEFMDFEKNKDAYKKLYGNDSVDEKLNRVYSEGLSRALRKKNTADYAKLKSKLQESGTKNSERIILLSDLQLFQQNKDWKSYITASNTYIEKYASDNASDLNNIAWVYYEKIDDKEALKKAVQWAKHATEIENNYGNNDTYAAVLYKSGQKEEAEKAAEKAIGLAKISGENASETEELLKKIRKMKPGNIK